MKFQVAIWAAFTVVAACTAAPDKNELTGSNQDGADAAPTVPPLVIKTIDPVASSATVSATGTSTTTGVGGSVDTSVAVNSVPTFDPRSQDTPTPTPAPTPYTCLAPRAKAIGSRGGSYGLGNPGEKLYAPLLIPAGFDGAIEFTVKSMEVADYALINIGTLSFEYAGGSRPVSIGTNIGPLAASPGNSPPMFSVVIASNPRNNMAQQHFSVWYQLEFKVAGYCPVF